VTDTTVPRFDPRNEQPYAKHPEHVRYRYVDRRLPMAVNAALTTSRPLLLRGEPGSGKSTLAADVALWLGWRYFEHVISSRMIANDLLWRFDAIKRLSDAQSRGKAKSAAAYIKAQPLWQTLRPESAAKYRGDDDASEPDDASRGAVLLLDEIDKADPDLPNDLLVVLGKGEFVVSDVAAGLELGALRKHRLIVITTNGERELPPAFLRRCVCLRLETPQAAELKQIAISHMPKLATSPHLDGWIARMFAIRDACKSDQHKPGTAEILDAIRACDELGVTTDHHPDWIALTLAMGWKNPEAPPAKIAT
jgi:MoxR-like ATPase